MKNLDVLAKQKADIMLKINQAMKDGNEEGFSQAFTEFTDILQEGCYGRSKRLSTIC